ncbi:MAG: SpoIIIAH-like family protein [Acutalibacteraceae bacterium]
MFGKRQLVLAALVISLGAAIYLNWQFTKKAGESMDAGSELGKAQYVNTTVSKKNDTSSVASGTDSKPNNTESSSQASSEEEKTVQTVQLTDEAEKYFAQARIDRQKAQDEITELAKEVLELASSDSQARTEAVENVAEIANIIEQQSNIESLIKAKGFTECMAFIQNGECSIIVNKGALSEASAIAIKDIVKGQAGIGFDKIKIVEI